MLLPRTNCKTFLAVAVLQSMARQARFPCKLSMSFINIHSGNIKIRLSGLGLKSFMSLKIAFVGRLVLFRALRARIGDPGRIPNHQNFLLLNILKKSRPVMGKKILADKTHIAIRTRINKRSA